MWLNGMVPLTCSLISSFVFAWCFVTRIFLLCRPHRNIWYHMFFQCWFGLMMTMIPGYRKKFCVEQYHCLVNWTPRLLFCYTKEWRLIIWLTNDQYKNDTPFFKTLWTHLTNGLQCMCKACMLCDHVINFFLVQLVKQAVLPRVHGLALKTTVAAVCTVYTLVYYVWQCTYYL
jgi:hypothetical protein